MPNDIKVDANRIGDLNWISRNKSTIKNITIAGTLEINHMLKKLRSSLEQLKSPRISFQISSLKNTIMARNDPKFRHISNV
ncbi:hypothetical protein FACS189449_09150 [Alphaproteobacteria bacterium]|nr:hypothetical protein FACS189449_09150 [Alphaproteobacteria bacterium]